MLSFVTLFRGWIRFSAPFVKRSIKQSDIFLLFYSTAREQERSRNGERSHVKRVESDKNLQAPLRESQNESESVIENTCTKERRGKERSPRPSLSAFSHFLQHHGSRWSTLETGSADSPHAPSLSIQMPSWAFQSEAENWHKNYSWALTTDTAETRIEIPKTKAPKK